MFELSAHPGKTDLVLISDDERHFAEIARALRRSVDDLTARRGAALRAPVRTGQAALDRDQDVHRLTARLRMLERFGLDLCLGRIVAAGSDATVYVGRIGLSDPEGRRLLVDWRSPAAEPFFAATHAHPMGLASRRRYRWTGGRITDYWDEVFTPDGLERGVALDDQSAFIASLAGARTDRMRDVLGTIQADQDAIVRAGSHGALVVDGGPGTGKTVVALHRTAYLLYADPRLGHRRGGVLFVGPHRPYLSYVADVLPSLGEEGVQTCTLRDLVPEGATVTHEADPAVAALKASLELVRAIEPAVRFYEEPPNQPLTVETPWADVRLDAEDWAAAFDAAEPGVPHNEAREQVWDAIVARIADQHDSEVPADELDRALRGNEELRAMFDHAWPVIHATDLVGDLWSVPAYLRRCAPGLAPEDVRRLQRADARAWTVADLPLLDAAQQRVGDPTPPRQGAPGDASVREVMDRVVDYLIETDDSEMAVMSMLRGDDLQSVLVDDAEPAMTLDRLAGPFAHIVVDEAQELTDAEWQMLLRRCPSRSFTIVGDRAQARHGFAEPWSERLGHVGFDRVALATLTINYRTPTEVMAEAEPVIRSVLPDANVPISVRSNGIPVRRVPRSELTDVVDGWLHTHAEGTVCVIGDPAFAETARVHSLTPELAKGLEFDLVVLVDPPSYVDGIEDAVDRYVAMTRATEQLVIVDS